MLKTPSKAIMAF